MREEDGEGSQAMELQVMPANTERHCPNEASTCLVPSLQYETLPSDDEDSEDIDGDPPFRSDADGKSSITLSDEHIGVNDGDHTYCHQKTASYNAWLRGWREENVRALL
ncbi:hypothetical protein ACFX2H_043870 [Malus domestica]